jgi:CheY-like chemotaxis protein
MPVERLDPVRVLIVDDAAVSREALAAVVEATPGFQVVAAAESGMEALEIVASEASPELVLLDVQMPQMDGVETARRIGRLGRGVVVALLSARKHAPAFEKGSLAVIYKGDVTREWLSGLWERRSGSS